MNQITFVDWKDGWEVKSDGEENDDDLILKKSKIQNPSRRQAVQKPKAV